MNRQETEPPRVFWKASPRTWNCSVPLQRKRRRRRMQGRKSKPVRQGTAVFLLQGVAQGGRGEDFGPNHSLPTHGGQCGMRGGSSTTPNNHLISSFFLRGVGKHGKVAEKGHVSGLASLVRGSLSSGLYGLFTVNYGGHPSGHRAMESIGACCLATRDQQQRPICSSAILSLSLIIRTN